MFMDYTKVKDELVHISRLTYQKGYTQASGGNISCRVPGTSFFAIKKTAVNMGEMTVADVLIVDEDGSVIDGQGVPSKEVNFHIGIMKVREDVNAVVHCHPCYAIAFADACLSLPHTTVTSKKNLGEIPCVAAASAGSAELKEYVVDAFRTKAGIKGILMEQHGICAVGASLINAFNMADLIEGTAKQAYLCLEVSRNAEYFKQLTP
ncbi:aldolase [Lacrimispora brassicae]